MIQSAIKKKTVKQLYTLYRSNTESVGNFIRDS